MARLVDEYGYWAVALLVALESLGLPIPGETALVAAGAYAGETHKLSPWLIFVVAATGATAGNIAGYLIGRYGGYPLARRYGPKVRLDEHKLKVGRYVLDRHGGKVVFAGRFIAVLRTYVAFLAGTVWMARGKFLVATVAGAVAWAGAYTVAAYEAAATLKRLSGTVDLVAVALAVLVAVGVLVAVRHSLRLLGARAEEAYPGPLS